jgi:hypothetical protein
MAHLKTFAQFCWQWIVLATAGGSKAEKIAKLVALAFALIFAVAASSKIRISLMTDVNGGEMLLPWQPTIGFLILTFLFIMWACVAFGITWSSFKSLEIGNILEYGQSSGYLLPIRNMGLTSREIPVYAMAVANSESVLEQPHLPLELPWMHHGGTRPILSRGIWHKAEIFVAVGGQEEGGTWESQLAFVGLNRPGNRTTQVNIGRVSQANKNRLWIQVAIGDHANTRWFSIEAGDSFGHCKTDPGDPPFIKPSLLHQLAPACKLMIGGLFFFVLATLVTRDFGAIIGAIVLIGIVRHIIRNYAKD